MNALRGTYAGLAPSGYADNYPSRATALAIIDAMKTCNDWQGVEKVTGAENARDTAERCFMVYGYPELEPTKLARWVAEGFERWASDKTPSATVMPSVELPAPDHSHGLGRR